MSRVLAIGDIHGCLHALETLLQAVQPTQNDTVITLGDYVHRGPDTFGVLDRLIALHQTHQTISLLGNHEDIFVNAHQVDRSSLSEAHWRFLEETCRDVYETETHFFVHANAAPDIPIVEQPVFMSRWEKITGPVGVQPHDSGKIMVCGHTAQKSGQPLNLGFAVCIDTYCYGGGWLTCLDVTTGRYWQASQSGQTRQGYLPEPQEFA